MTVEQVLELTQAGFTADEIRTMINQQEQPQEPEQIEDQEQEQQEQTEDSTQNELNEMREAITQLTKTIHAANVLNAHAGQKTMTVDEAADAAIQAFFKA